MKTAILGAGGMGRTVIGHLQKCSGVSRIVAYDPREEALEKTHRECGVEVSRSLEKTLADPELKLVFITASNDAHKELALTSLRAGKAVMCEKPMANSLEDSQEMAEAAEQLGGFLQIGFELRYSHLYSTVKKWIDEGKLGEVRNIDCNYIASEGWGRDSWRTKLATGGSMFGEKLSHYVDLPRWWTGEEVREVYSAASPNVVPYYEVRDNYHTSCTFGNGAVCHIAFMMPFAATYEKVRDSLVDRIIDQREDGHELRYLVMGTQGAAETNLFHRKIKRWEFGENGRGFTSRLVETLEWEEKDDHTFYHNTRDQAHDIVRRVREGLPPAISPWDALETMKVCEAADISVNESRVVWPSKLLEHAMS